MAPAEIYQNGKLIHTVKSGEKMTFLNSKEQIHVFGNSEGFSLVRPDIVGHSSKLDFCDGGNGVVFIENVLIKAREKL